MWVRVHFESLMHQSFGFRCSEESGFACSGVSAQVRHVRDLTGMGTRALASGVFEGRGRVRLGRQRADQQRRFAALWWIYSHDGRGRDTAPALPGDLCTAVERGEASACMYADQPALLTACLRGKDGPWKEALLESWRAAKLRRSGVSAFRGSPAAFTYGVLRSTAIAMAKKDTTLWQGNLGKGVSHHSGWLPFLQASAGILRKVAGGRSRSSGVVLNLGGGGEQGRYRVLAFTPTIAEKLEVLHVIGTVLRTLSAPTSCEQWEQARAEAAKQMRDQGAAKHTKNPYLWPWLLRSRLVALMRTAGIKQLKWKNDMQTSELRGMFPDQRQHLTRLFPGVPSVKRIFKEVSYTGPVELFTMYTCLFCSDSLAPFAVDTIWAERKRLAHARLQYFAKHTLQPHPLTLLQEGLAN